jgi:checkpoint serine/threonine-protein kinase
MLVDFGRAVDLTQFSDEYDDIRKVVLHGNACRDDMRCVAMRNGKPWSFDIDTYGILCTAHVLLHGTHMSIRKGTDNQWRPESNLKRYWQKDLWNEIFKSLLNFDDVSGAAIGSRARSLRALREKIDTFLKKEGSNLRSLLTRQANLLPTSREK